MERDLLHKYFSGHTSDEENGRILRWFEESEDNRRVFQAERKLWNMAALAQEVPAMPERKAMWRYVAAAASCVLLLVGVGVLASLSWQGEAVHTVTVPVGQRARVQLADGTSVWLNSNSVFTYGTGFGGKNRTVQLVGEAYFDVRRDERHPFVVETGRFKVEVLGTEFNVCAYDSVNLFETAVVDGTVKVTDKEYVRDEAVVLGRGEKIACEDGRLVKRKLDNKLPQWWKNGVLAFDDEPIGNVVDRLGAYYGKTIEMRFEEHADYRCSAKFYYNDGLDYILRIIQREVHYEIVNLPDENKIILK